MGLEKLIFLYAFLLLGAIGIHAFWDELRRRSFETGKSDDRVFRCEKCNFVYTDDPVVERSRCPHCGRTNEPYNF